MKKKILLTTLNARYAHTAIGLKYLYANMQTLKKDTLIQEYTINENLQEIAENLLNFAPLIIGIGVYIWNASQVSRLVQLLKAVSPETVIVLGGPEVSYEPLRLDFQKADYIIQGEADLSFYMLCNQLLNGESAKVPRIQKAIVPDLIALNLPYTEYTEADIANRVIYVEASRGCPFSCDFCLSSISKEVRYFDLNKVLASLQLLWEKGARNFKFIDRTFNLNIDYANLILDFFLSKKNEHYLLHFEVIPEHFPVKLKDKLKKFPLASLQLEVGIQTLNKENAKRINRPLNFEKIKENLVFLATETKAHLHVDLIIGLPGESIAEFAGNLNTLMSITAAEIQLGILKKLSGTAICKHDQNYEMVYSAEPPYEILQNNLIPFAMMQKLKRLARFWDLVYNSGNFKRTVNLLWEEDTVFTAFFQFSEWLYTQTETTWQISLNRLAEFLFNYLTKVKKGNKKEVAFLMAEDLLSVSGRRLPQFLRENLSELPEYQATILSNVNKRQLKHLIK